MVKVKSKVKTSTRKTNQKTKIDQKIKVNQKTKKEPEVKVKTIQQKKEAETSKINTFVPLGNVMTDAKVINITENDNVVKIEFIIYNENKVKFEQHVGEGDKENKMYGFVEGDVRFRDSIFRINNYDRLNRKQKAQVRAYASMLITVYRSRNK